MASDITSTTQWKALENHHNSLREVTLRELFDADPSRASTLTFNAAGLHVDLSKNRVNDETLALLIDLANAAGLKNGSHVHRRPPQQHRGSCRTTHRAAATRGGRPSSGQPRRRC